MLRQLGQAPNPITALQLTFQLISRSVDQAAMSRRPRSAGARPERTDMNDTLIGAQYSTGLSRRNVERVLVAAEKDIDHLEPESALPTRSGGT